MTMNDPQPEADETPRWWEKDLFSPTGFLGFDSAAGIVVLALATAMAAFVFRGRQETYFYGRIVKPTDFLSKPVPIKLAGGQLVTATIRVSNRLSASKNVVRQSDYRLNRYDLGFSLTHSGADQMAALETPLTIDPTKIVLTDSEGFIFKIRVWQSEPPICSVGDGNSLGRIRFDDPSYYLSLNVTYQLNGSHALQIARMDPQKARMRLRKDGNVLDPVFYGGSFLIIMALFMAGMKLTGYGLKRWVIYKRLGTKRKKPDRPQSR
jgi:hypothetical protein